MLPVAVPPLRVNIMQQQHLSDDSTHVAAQKVHAAMQALATCP